METQVVLGHIHNVQVGINKIVVPESELEHNAHSEINELMIAYYKALAAGDKVSVLGFGTFEVRARGARTGLNPRTGEKLQIAATKVPVFKAGQALKDAVAK